MPRTTAEIDVRACVDERGGAGKQIFASTPRVPLPAYNQKRRLATILSLRDDSIGVRAGREDALEFVDIEGVGGGVDAAQLAPPNHCAGADARRERLLPRAAARVRRASSRW